MHQELSLEEVRHVAKLARLSLSANEEEAARGQLTAILAAVDALSQVQTDDVEPTSHASLMESLWREDVVVPGLSTEEALANAPERVGQGFAVPRVIE